MLDEAAERERLAPGSGRGSWRPEPEPIDVLGRRSRRAPLLGQGEYDRTRPDGAPSASRLSRRYGGWETACRAAFGLQADGTYPGHGQPWPAAWRGPGSKPRPYTREECLDGIRACARALGRRPTVETYRAWLADQARRARAGDKPRPRLADYNTLRRQFGGWPAAAAAAAARRRRRRCRRARRLAGMAGGQDRRARRDAPARVTRPRRHAGARATRAGRGVPEDALLDALDVSRSAWRRITAGSTPTTLEQLAALASVLEVSCESLMGTVGPYGGQKVHESV